ncbi:MAG: STAS domain-containing protein [Chloroflexi bacterium]|nr:STAS domain-containing protein [Chloroflexota bacterium]
MSESDINISVETHKRVAVLTVGGRIDSSNAAQLDNTLKQLLEENNNIVVELSGVEYMSSAGLRAIVAALREAKKKRGDVRLAAPSQRVNEVFSLAGLTVLFQTYDDLTAAVGSF